MELCDGAHLECPCVPSPPAPRRAVARFCKIELGSCWDLVPQGGEPSPLPPRQFGGVTPVPVSSQSLPPLGLLVAGLPCNLNTFSWCSSENRLVPFSEIPAQRCYRRELLDSLFSLFPLKGRDASWTESCAAVLPTCGRSGPSPRRSLGVGPGCGASLLPVRLCPVPAGEPRGCRAAASADKALSEAFLQEGVGVCFPHRHVPCCPICHPKC